MRPSALQQNFNIGTGVFLGSLALAFAHQGNTKEAFQCIEEGEVLVTMFPSEYGKFLCKKATIFHLAYLANDANEALKHAQKIALQIKTTEESELGKAIREVETCLSKKENLS